MSKKTNDEKNKAAHDEPVDVLKPEHREFCRVYVAQPTPKNQTKAYMEVYHTNNYNSAAASATMLLKKQKIRDEIKRLEAEYVHEHIVTRDNVLKEFWDVYKCCRQYQPVLDSRGQRVKVKLKAKQLYGSRDVDGEEGETEQYYCVYKFDSRGALTALTAMAKYLGMLDGDGATVNINVSAEVSSMREMIAKEMERVHKADKEVEIVDTNFTKTTSKDGQSSELG